MKPWLLVVALVLTGCALKAPTSACSDPLRLYTDVRYEACCVAHDDAYERGGTERDRHAADFALYQCVGVYSEQDARSMYVAVRAFGDTRFRFKEK